VEHANWSQWERLLAHTQSYAQWIETEGLHLQEAAVLLQMAGWYLTERARYSEAEPLLAQAYQVSQQQQGAKHLDTARDASTLASLYQAQGKYTEAEPLYVRALAIREQQLGPLHPHAANSLNNLANLYNNQSKYEQTEPLYVRTLAICEQQLGPTHPHTLIDRGNYVAFLRTIGRDAEARALEMQHLPPS
jgi:tetratricopeptide (TPR) repeat protein